MSNKETVKVTIYGTEYSVKAGENPDYVKSVAKYVDTVMLEIDNNMGSKSPLKVAVLAALNIADELMHEKENNRKMMNLADDGVQRLIDKITSKTGHVNI